MNIQELKKKSSEQLITQAEELGIENASTLRRQEILFAFLKKVAEKEEITGVGVLQSLQDGFGFGSDFRVYGKGDFGEKGAKFLVFGLNEGKQEKVGKLQKKVEEITKMGKEPIIAVIQRQGEIIYYKISRMNFYQNTSKMDMKDFEF